ncbi:hypothetical protein Tco_1320973 [Tanacetum coccineum]
MASVIKGSGIAIPKTSTDSPLGSNLRFPRHIILQWVCNSRFQDVDGCYYYLQVMISLWKTVHRDEERSYFLFFGFLDWLCGVCNWVSGLSLPVVFPVIALVDKPKTYAMQEVEREHFVLPSYSAKEHLTKKTNIAEKRS